MKKQTKKKAKTLSQLTHELDKWFSLFIRHRESKDGMNRCVSCGRTLPIKELQCGHYVSRSNRSTRWDENNCWPQDAFCNVFKNGNYPEYTKYLLDRFGQKWLDDLIKKGREIKKFTRFDLQEKINYYKEWISQNEKK